MEKMYLKNGEVMVVITKKDFVDLINSTEKFFRRLKRVEDALGADDAETLVDSYGGIIDFLCKKFGFFDKPLKEDIQGFDYEDFLKNLQKAKLEFGIRMYVPNLMRNMKIVPFKNWSKAVFTEGMFKKATRMAIMNYWRQLKEKNYF